MKKYLLLVLLALPSFALAKSGSNPSSTGDIVAKEALKRLPSFDGATSGGRILDSGTIGGKPAYSKKEGIFGSSDENGDGTGLFDSVGEDGKNHGFLGLDKDGDGSMWTSTDEDGTKLGLLDQKGEDDKNHGFMGLDKDGDGSMWTEKDHGFLGLDKDGDGSMWTTTTKFNDKGQELDADGNVVKGGKQLSKKEMKERKEKKEKSKAAGAEDDEFSVYRKYDYGDGTNWADCLDEDFGFGIDMCPGGRFTPPYPTITLEYEYNDQVAMVEVVPDPWRSFLYGESFFDFSGKAETSFLDGMGMAPSMSAPYGNNKSNSKEFIGKHKLESHVWAVSDWWRLKTSDFKKACFSLTCKNKDFTGCIMSVKQTIVNISDSVGKTIDSLNKGEQVPGKGEGYTEVGENGQKTVAYEDGSVYKEKLDANGNPTGKFDQIRDPGNYGNSTLGRAAEAAMSESVIPGRSNVELLMEGVALAQDPEGYVKAKAVSMAMDYASDSVTEYFDEDGDGSMWTSSEYYNEEGKQIDKNGKLIDGGKTLSSKEMAERKAYRESKKSKGSSKNKSYLNKKTANKKYVDSQTSQMDSWAKSKKASIEGTSSPLPEGTKINPKEITQRTTFKVSAYPGQVSSGGAYSRTQSTVVRRDGSKVSTVKDSSGRIDTTVSPGSVGGTSGSGGGIKGVSSGSTGTIGASSSGGNVKVASTPDLSASKMQESIKSSPSYVEGVDDLRPGDQITQSYVAKGSDGKDYVVTKTGVIGKDGEVDQSTVSQTTDLAVEDSTDAANEASDNLTGNNSEGNAQARDEMSSGIAGATDALGSISLEMAMSALDRIVYFNPIELMIQLIATKSPIMLFPVYMSERHPKPSADGGFFWSPIFQKFADFGAGFIMPLFCMSKSVGMAVDGVFELFMEGGISSDMLGPIGEFINGRCVGSWGPLEPRVTLLGTGDHMVAAGLASVRGLNVAQNITGSMFNKTINNTPFNSLKFNLEWPHQSSCYGFQGFSGLSRSWTTPLGGVLDGVSDAVKTGDVSGIVTTPAKDVANAVRNQGGYIFTYWRHRKCKYLVFCNKWKGDTGL